MALTLLHSISLPSCNFFYVTLWFTQFCRNYCIVHCSCLWWMINILVIPNKLRFKMYSFINILSVMPFVTAHAGCKLHILPNNIFGYWEFAHRISFSYRQTSILVLMKATVNAPGYDISILQNVLGKKGGRVVSDKGHQ